MTINCKTKEKNKREGGGGGDVLESKWLGNCANTKFNKLVNAVEKKKYQMSGGGVMLSHFQSGRGFPPIAFKTGDLIPRGSSYIFLIAASETPMRRDIFAPF